MTSTIPQRVKESMASKLEVAITEMGLALLQNNQKGLAMHPDDKNSVMGGAKCPDSAKPEVGSVMPIVQKLGLGIMV